MPNINTTELRKINLDNFVNAITNEKIYFTFSNPDAWTDENNPDVPLDSYDLRTDVFFDMIYGKRITTTNISRVIRNYNWKSGLRYQQYSLSEDIDKISSPRTYVRATGTATISAGSITAISIDNGGAEYATAPTISFSGGGGTGAAATCTIVSGSVATITIINPGSGYTSAPTVSFTYPTNVSITPLEVRPFYVITKDYRVYKCLNNNSNGVSTVEPTSVDTSAGAPSALSDGYVWKYLFTISTTNKEKFYTSTWIPIQTLTEDNGTDQWEVQINALPGATGSLVPYHGIDPVRELNATNLMVKVRVSGNEGGAIADSNDYRQISLVRNPIFANTYYNCGYTTVVSGATGATGIAIVDTDISLDDSTTLIDTNDVIQINDERMLVTNGATSPITVTRGYDGTTITFHFSGDKVNIVSDTTKMILNDSHIAGATGVSYPDVGKQVVLIDGSGAGQIRTISAYTNPEITVSEPWITPPTVNTRYGFIANSLVVNQCVILELGTVTNGPFDQDSTVTQSTSNATGKVIEHDTDSIPELLYLTSISGTFDGTNNISSGLVSSIVTAVTQRDLEVGLGNVLYIDNRKYITRYADQIEDIKVIIEF